MEKDPKLVVQFNTSEEAQAVSEHLYNSTAEDNLLFIEENEEGGVDLAALFCATSLEGIGDDDFKLNRVS